MKENEAIEKLKNMRLFMQIEDKSNDCKFTEDDYKANEMAIQALETIKKLSDRKMTTKVLKNYIQFEDECVKKGFAFKSVIEAREKQISKKPDFTEDKEFALCSCRNGKGLFDKQKYCVNCGQKLDWSDEE